MPKRDINLLHKDHPEHPWIMFPLCCGEPAPETGPENRPDGYGTDRKQVDLYCANCGATLAFLSWSDEDAEELRQEHEVEVENAFWDAHYAAVQAEGKDTV